MQTGTRAVLLIPNQAATPCSSSSIQSKGRISLEQAGGSCQTDSTGSSPVATFLAHESSIAPAAHHVCIRSTHEALGKLKFNPSGAGKSILDSSFAIPPGVSAPDAGGVPGVARPPFWGVAG